MLGLGARAVLRGVLGLEEPAFLREAPAGESSDILSNETKTQELCILKFNKLAKALEVRKQIPETDPCLICLQDW